MVCSSNGRYGGGGMGLTGRAKTTWYWNKYGVDGTNEAAMVDMVVVEWGSKKCDRGGPPSHLDTPRCAATAAAAADAASRNNMFSLYNLIPFPSDFYPCFPTTSLHYTALVLLLLNQLHAWSKSNSSSFAHFYKCNSVSVIAHHNMFFEKQVHTHIHTEKWKLGSRNTI